MIQEVLIIRSQCVTNNTEANFIFRNYSHPMNIYHSINTLFTKSTHALLQTK